MGRQGSGKTEAWKRRKRFMGVADKPVAELGEYQEKLKARTLPGMQAADKRTALALREAGIRGPQAGLERSRQAGKAATALDESLSKYALQDAQRRQAAKLQYLGGGR